MDVDSLSNLIEEVTDDFMVNVMQFFAEYKIKTDIKSFVDSYFDRSELRLFANTHQILSYEECVREENLNGKGLGEDKKEFIQAKKNGLKSMVTYKEPFVQMYMPYSSPMQMKLRFKYYICQLLNLDTADLKREEQEKTKHRYSSESMNSLPRISEGCKML